MNINPVIGLITAIITLVVAATVYVHDASQQAEPERKIAPRHQAVLDGWDLQEYDREIERQKAEDLRYYGPSALLGHGAYPSDINNWRRAMLAEARKQTKLIEAMAGNHHDHSSNPYTGE